MTMLPAISLVLDGAFVALTPLERLSAARKLTGNFTPEHWMIFVCIAALILLVGLFLWVSFNRARQERKSTGRSFIEYARQRGLSNRECQLLAIVANRAGLKRPESIFTMGSAFGIGAARVLEEGIGGERTDGDSELLKTEISFLREKLGFGKQPSAMGESAGGPKVLSSRQIPAGKKLYVTRRKARASTDIEATVKRNSEAELAVTLTTPVKVIFGETWCVRYYSGASVWEFDTTVISYDGDTLVLNHSNNVRFVNRRRFLRVETRLRCFVAHFPFARVFAGTGGAGADDGRTGRDMAGTSSDKWGPPEFVAGVVTELAGPGLRIESALAVDVGERVLVVFSLDEEGADLMRAVRVVEDVGEVRHIRAAGNGFSIAVELTSLKDSDVDELICATNAASLRASAKAPVSPQPVAEGTGGESRASVGDQEAVMEPSVAQGV
jgi:hypothetical protein